MKKVLIGILSIFVFVSLIPVVSAVEARFFVTEVAPQQIEPGEVTTLNITVKNLGSGPAGYATYVRASLDPRDTSPIDPIGIGEMFLTKKAKEALEAQGYYGVVLQGEELKISFPIYARLNTSEDVYDVPLLMEWKDNKLEDQNQTILIGILVKGDISLGIASVETDPAKIRSGDDNVKITLTVENSGEGVAKSVKAELLSKEPFKPSYSQTNIAYIGRLNSDATQTTTFYLDVEETAKPENYEIPILITYEDLRDNKYEVEKSINIIVEPKPYFEVVSSKLVPSIPKAGEHALLYVDIKNIGYENGESIDLRVVREAGQPFTFDVRSDFIGTLKPGEIGTAVLEFDVDKDANPKEYLLKLLVRSTGDTEKGDTNVYTQELKASVNVEKGTPEQSKNLLYGAAIAGIILVVGLIYRQRKSKG